MLAAPPFLTPFLLAQRNMRTRRGRTLLTLLGIVLGVAVVLAIQVTNQSTLDALRQVFDRAAGQASLVIVPTNQGAERVPEELRYSIEKINGVLAAAPAVRVQTLLASEAESWQIAFSINGITPGNLFLLYGIDPVLDPEVRVYLLSEGRMPAAEAYEAVIPQAYALEKGLSIGEDVVLLSPKGSLRLRITGLLADEGVALLNDSVVGFAPLNVVQELFGAEGEVDEISLRIESAISEEPRALEALKDEIENETGRDGDVIYPAARGRLVSQMMATYQLGLTFFSFIAVFVGAFLIYNTFSMTIVERTREIGMLRAIGMSRWGILGMVFAEALLLAGLGSLLGTVGGLALARGLMVLLGGVVVTSQESNGLPWNGLGQSLAVGIGVTFVAAVLPALQAARIPPLEALRARSKAREKTRPILWLSGLTLLFAGYMVIYHVPFRSSAIFPVGSVAIIMALMGATLTVTLVVGWLEHLSRPLAKVLYGNEGALGSANVRRSVIRTTLTVAALMVSLTMIIAIDSLAFSFKQDMTFWIDNALGGDLYVRAPITMRDSFGRQLESIQGVASVTPTRILAVRAAPSADPSGKGELDDSFLFNAIDPETYRQIGDVEFAANQGDREGNWQRLAQGDAVFISNVVADNYRLDKGDSLSLLTKRGEHAFTVAGVVVDFTGQGQMVYGSYEDLQRWYGESGADRFTVSIKPGYTVEEVAAEIEERYQKRKHISVQTTEDFKQSILDLMNQSFRLFDVLTLIGVTIGALGVINTLTMNVLERQQEIGGLRSLGMTRRQVLQMVLAEALALGIMGGVYGLPIGYFIARVMIRGTNMMIGYDLEYMFTPDPFITSAVIALFVVQLAALYPAQRAARINIIEAIKHE